MLVMWESYFVFVLLLWEHCGAYFEDLTYGLCTYNFWMCITLERLNISNSALMVPALETWELISLENILIIFQRNKLTKVYSAYMVNK